MFDCNYLRMITWPLGGAFVTRYHIPVKVRMAFTYKSWYSLLPSFVYKASVLSVIVRMCWPLWTGRQGCFGVLGNVSE